MLQTQIANQQPGPMMPSNLFFWRKLLEERLQAFLVLGSSIVLSSGIRPTHTITIIGVLFIPEVVDRVIKVPFSDLMAWSYEWSQGHNLAAILHVQEEQLQLLIELSCKRLVVDQDDVRSLDGFPDRIILQEIISLETYPTRFDAPETTPCLEFFLLTIGQRVSVLHHFATPAFTTNLQSSLQDYVPDPRAQVNEDLVGLDSGLLKDPRDK